MHLKCKKPILICRRYDCEQMHSRINQQLISELVSCPHFGLLRAVNNVVEYSEVKGHFTILKWPLTLLAKLVLINNVFVTPHTHMQHWGTYSTITFMATEGFTEPTGIWKAYCGWTTANILEYYEGIHSIEKMRTDKIKECSAYIQNVLLVL